jgi:hypothetical protein
MLPSSGDLGARGLWLTAVLSGSVALFSGLLAFHYEHEDYTEGEEVLYRVFLIVSTGTLLCSGMSVALIYVFG